MSDPFRQFFLDTVEKVISQPPNDEQSLLTLLQIASPNLSLEKLLSSRNEERHKIFKALILRIHPDKHPNDTRVTELFQNVQNFYHDCCHEIFDTAAASSSCSLTRLPTKKNSNKNSRYDKGVVDDDDHDHKFNTVKKRRKTASAVSNFPPEFSIYTKWPHMKDTFLPSSNTSSNNSNHNHQNDGDSNDIDNDDKKKKNANNSSTHNSATSSSTSSSSSWTKNKYQYPYPPTETIFTKQTLATVQAYKCIHLRGSIAHGKRITKFFPWSITNTKNTNSTAKGGNGVKQPQPQLPQQPHQHQHQQQYNKNHETVKDVFDSNFNGHKILDTVEEIKEEIMNHGPVISTSFELTAAYINQLQNEKYAFASNLVNQGGVKKEEDHEEKRGERRKRKGNNNATSNHCQHELLIVGWSMTPYGEAWKVQYLIDVKKETTSTATTTSASSASSTTASSINKNADTTTNDNMTQPSIVHVGVGQFHIDDLCLAPKSKLENIPWQHGPYFETDFSDAPEWRQWKEMDLPLTERELISLGKCFKKKGLFANESFVIRDKDKVGHSAMYVVKNLRWDDDTDEWIVTVTSAE